MMSLGDAEPSAKTVLMARSTKTEAVSLPRSNASFTSGERQSGECLTAASSERLSVGGRLDHRMC